MTWFVRSSARIEGAAKESQEAQSQKSFIIRYGENISNASGIVASFKKFRIDWEISAGCNC